MKINKILLIILTSLGILSFWSCEDDDIVKESYLSEGIFEGDYFPTTSWKYCEPEEVGIESEKLRLVHEYAASQNYETDGYVIIKDGYIIAEDYFDDFTIDKSHTSFSVAKSFLSSLIGIAIDQGHIDSKTDKIAEYITYLQHDTIPQAKKDITVENLLTMSGGFQWQESAEGDLTQNDIYAMVLTSQNYVEYVLNKPMANTPGTVWNYSSGETIVLSEVLEEATNGSTFDFAQTNLFSKIGMDGVTWDSDPSGNTIGGWGINATLHNFAKFGYLYLNNGNWNGTQVVSEAWVERSISPAREGVSHYGYLWWLPDRFSMSKSATIPADTYMAIGLFQQCIVVIPSLDLIIVRMGNDMYTTWDMEQFIKLVVEAVN